jgi:hypothetical protein
LPYNNNCFVKKQLKENTYIYMGESGVVVVGARGYSNYKRRVVVKKNKKSISISIHYSKNKSNQTKT